MTADIRIRILAALPALDALLAETERERTKPGNLDRLRALKDIASILRDDVLPITYCETNH